MSLQALQWWSRVVSVAGAMSSDLIWFVLSFLLALSCDFVFVLDFLFLESADTVLPPLHGRGRGYSMSRY
jgi:hypothetical protein